MKTIYTFIDKNKDIIPNNRIVITGNFYLKKIGICTKEKTDVDIFFDSKFVAFDYTDCKLCACFVHKGVFTTDYESRMIELETYNEIKIYALSFEDVIINKISAYEKEKHKNDISIYMRMTTIEKVKNILSSAEQRDYGVYEKVFRPNIELFKSDYGVQ